MKELKTVSDKFELPIFHYDIYYEEIDILENEPFPIYILKNVYINPFKKNEKHYDMYGTWMCISDGGRQYGHYIKESIGSFLYCKKIFPELKPFFLETHLEDVYKHQVLSHIINFVNQKIINDFVEEKIYLYGNDIWHSSFFIENLVIMMDNGKVWFNYQYPHFEECQAPHVSKALVEYFDEYRIIDNSTPKKIFMTRKNVSNELKEKGLIDHSHFKYRYFDDWMEDGIEQAFIDKGYSIVNWSGMSLQDQIKISYNATHIAGIIGTSFHNGMWAKDGTKFYAIRPNNIYLFDWEHDIVNLLKDVSFTYIDSWDYKTFEDVYNFVYNSIAE